MIYLHLSKEDIPTALVKTAIFYERALLNEWKVLDDFTYLAVPVS